MDMATEVLSERGKEAMKPLVYYLNEAITAMLNPYDPENNPDGYMCAVIFNASGAVE